MSNLIKLGSLMLVMNIFAYIAVNMSIMSVDGTTQLNPDYNFFFKDDLISKYLGGKGGIDTIAQDTKDGFTSYGLYVNSSFATIPALQTGVSSATDAYFTDPLKIIYSFLATLGNVIISPLTLFFNFHIPPVIGIMIGVPYFFILGLTIILLIRGIEA